MEIKEIIKSTFLYGAVILVGFYLLARPKKK
jgi:hypothetical protein